MPLNHLTLLRAMPDIRAELMQRFAAFRHITAYTRLNEIRTTGLTLRQYEHCPAEVFSELGATGDHIVCFWPFGAKLSPSGTSEPPLMSLAIAATNLPQRIGLDWSYSWEIVTNSRMQLYSGDTPAQFAYRIANDLGSIVSYEAIGPDHLLVRCKGQAKDQPLAWKPLQQAADAEILQHE